MRDRIYTIDLNTKMYEKPKYKQYEVLNIKYK